MIILLLDCIAERANGPHRLSSAEVVRPSSLVQKVEAEKSIARLIFINFSNQVLEHHPKSI